MITPWKVTTGELGRILIYYSQFEKSFDTLYITGRLKRNGS